MHAHKHTPLGQPPGGSWGPSARAASGERSLWSCNRPGPWQTALASSACQGAKADPAEGCWLCLHTITVRKTENLGPQSFCLCHYRALFNHSLTVFKSSGHINKHEHTRRQRIQRQTETELNALGSCLYWIIYLYILFSSGLFLLIRDTDVTKNINKDITQILCAGILLLCSMLCHRLKGTLYLRHNKNRMWLKESQTILEPQLCL